MLSYQHGYHAGNLADVHKHAMLAWMLDYLTRKDKPVTYMETHAGRGLYDLAAPEALKTGEASQGVAQALARGWFAPDDPYSRILERTRAAYGPTAYPGSPLIAALSLRPDDHIHLAELHPQEFDALSDLMLAYPATATRKDGLAMALGWTPPTPRRGLLMIDPSYEIKTDYDALPPLIRAVNRKWNVGIILLWYPILKTGVHKPMLRALADALPDAMTHEVRFPPARDGHGMIGSGLFIVNPPYGFDKRAESLSRRFAQP